VAGSLADLSLEELSSIVITSVSRRGEPVSQAPGSIYVITAQDIRRAGVTSLPEALRLAPNLLVARVNAHDYAITTSRGFLATGNAKLLVMIDGRSIYTPLFSGVLWEVHDVMLDDVERIEVISGPGGTTWGTNAVIGVINVVTKSASATKGVLASGYAGNREDGIAARYGASAGGGAFRLYAKHFDHDNFSRADGTPVPDGGWRNQAGFRADWTGARGGVTLQGDIYDAERQSADGLRLLSGFNLLGRWSRALAGGAGASVQAYFDRAERNDAGRLVQRMDIFDVEAQYAAAPIGAHRLTAGAGYREAADHTENDATLAFIPADRRLTWLNVYLQDEITLRPGLRLTLGARAEENSYTGWESMPSARLAWQPADGRLLWTAISRAVRSPSRFDRDFFQPAAPPFFVAGGPNFVSEVSDVFELGYRAQASPSISYSLTAFLHDHDHLRSFTAGPGGAVVFANRIEGRTRGVEGWGSWQAARTWRLSGGIVVLDQDLENEPGSTSNVFLEANDPSHSWMLRSSHELGERTELDFIVRHMAALPDGRVPAYTALDARLAWRVARWLELALVGQNLTDASHPEFGASATRAEIPRSLLLNARLALP
jgi:iron complex outermembrane receptor protein